MSKLARTNLAALSAQSSTERIERFLQGCFIRGECERIELRQITVRGANRVFDWVVAEEPEETRTPDAFAGYIDQQATEDALGLRGPTQYGVFVYRKDQGDYSWRFLFSKRSEMSDDGSFAETEPPDQTGLVSMAMRHAEAANRNAASMMQQFGMLILRQTNQLAAENEQHRARWFEMTQLHEDMSAAKAERELAANTAAKSAAQKDRIIDQVQLLAPAMLAKWMPGASEKQALAVHGVKEFMRSLKPEQVGPLMSTLTPEQQGALMTLFQTMEEQAKEEETPAPVGGAKKETVQ